ncbi:MAG TPA: DUF1289 domain-containing protein [Burkholderiales bacterium]|nr:DUF1289 domain-containing protein [Burkholderiales bacterium]
MRTVDVPSPCVKVCEIDPGSGYCRGCYRTITEIAGWPQFSARQKRKVWQLIERRARHGRARATG